MPTMLSRFISVLMNTYCRINNKRMYTHSLLEGNIFRIPGTFDIDAYEGIAEDDIALMIDQ